jgi:predicted metal-binding membrane protein
MRTPTTAVGRDPAVVLWASAGTCWALTAVLVLTGAAGPCHGGLSSSEGVARDGAGGPPAVTAFPAWLAMTGAMMLPTVVPLARMFVVATARVPRPAAARLALVAGYLSVWCVFAVSALLAHGAVDVLLDDAGRPGPVLGGVLIAAGLFQLSGLKRACLATCRSPWTFLWRHYARGIRGGWTLGVRHGLLCLGCCWALMLVMVATGIGSLFWMLALAGVMAVEKAAPWGARLVAPLGVALVVAGVTVLGAGAAGSGASSVSALLVAAVALALAWAAHPAVTRWRRRAHGVEPGS